MPLQVTHSFNPSTKRVILISPKKLFFSMKTGFITTFQINRNNGLYESAYHSLKKTLRKKCAEWMLKLHSSGEWQRVIHLEQVLLPSLFCPAKSVNSFLAKNILHRLTEKATPSMRHNSKSSNVFGSLKNMNFDTCSLWYWV